MSRNAIMIVLLGLLAVAVVIALSLRGTQGLRTGDSGVSVTPPPGPIFRDLASLVRGSPVVILGVVVQVSPGRIAGVGETQVRFSDVLLKIEKSFKGDVLSTVVVEHLASPAIVTSEVGPSYQLNERYVLFLRPGVEGRYVTVTQGRFLLANARVHPLEPGPLAERLRGEEESKLIDELESLIR